MAGRPNSKGREVVDPFARDERFIPPQAPIELIKRRNNDGSRLIRAFNYGDIPFFDTFGPYQVADNLVGPTDIKNPPNGYCADRRATFHNFLLNEAHNHTLSIIIPYEGVTEKWYELSECLLSIGRQTYMERNANCVEIILIQDGRKSKSRQLISDKLVDTMQALGCMSNIFVKLGKPAQRATLRNIGVFHARNDTLFFIDSSMILEANFLAEHMIRHAIAPSRFAIIGFKENISAGQYKTYRKRIAAGERLPDYRTDWKWRGKVSTSDEEFQYNGEDFAIGSKPPFMEMTNFLMKHEERKFRGDMRIGARMLPQFFHTGITSAPTDIVKQVGGFDETFDSQWGFEDSFLGALLFARDVKFIPCPSAVAFKIEDREKEESLEHKRQKQTIVAAQRGLFRNRLRERMANFNRKGLEKSVYELTRNNQIESQRSD